MEHVDQQLINGLQKRDLNAFEELSTTPDRRKNIVRNPTDAKEIVSDVLLGQRISERRLKSTLQLKGTIRPVRNTSLNYLGQKRQKTAY